MKDKMPISEEQKGKPGITDWIRLKNIRKSKI